MDAIISVLLFTSFLLLISSWKTPSRWPPKFR